MVQMDEVKGNADLRDELKKVILKALDLAMRQWSNRTHSNKTTHVNKQDFAECPGVSR